VATHLFWAETVVAIATSIEKTSQRTDERAIRSSHALETLRYPTPVRFNWYVWLSRQCDRRRTYYQSMKNRGGPQRRHVAVGFPDVREYDPR
jgi:hypothetical protein